MDEPAPLEERLTATYIRAMQDDCFSFYKPLRYPIPPSGYAEDYGIYKQISGDKRAVAWRKMLEKYAGYFKAVAETEAKNMSNVAFLNEMLRHFEGLGLLNYVSAIKGRLFEFEQVVVSWK